MLEKFNSKKSAQSLENTKKNVNFNVGDTISVGYRITEGNNTRLQYFEGVVIKKSRSSKNYNSAFTVRKISHEVGVERMFLFHSPLVEEIKLIKKGIVGRAKLYYLRKRRGKSARIEENIKDSKKKETK